MAWCRRPLGILPGRLGRRRLSAGGPGSGLSAGPGSVRQAGAVGGDALLDGLGEVLPQVEPVGDLDRVGAPVRAPSAYGPHRSRQITSMPGWAASQSASGWASRPEEVQRHAGLAVDQDVP